LDASWVQGPVLWILIVVGAIIAVALFSMSSLRVWMDAARKAKERMTAPPKD
jgi:NADH:ubiquinone oxidoreductase subunit 6 (subunit J)